jgi:hypothetical protein
MSLLATAVSKVVILYVTFERSTTSGVTDFLHLHLANLAMLLGTNNSCLNVNRWKHNVFVLFFFFSLEANAELLLKGIHGKYLSSFVRNCPSWSLLGHTNI